MDRSLSKNPIKGVEQLIRKYHWLGKQYYQHPASHYKKLRHIHVKSILLLDPSFLSHRLRENVYSCQDYEILNSPLPFDSTFDAGK